MSSRSREGRLPRPSIPLAEKLVSSLKASLPPKVEAVPPGIPPGLPFKVMSLREPLLCRIADLTEASIHLCKIDRGMGAAILARAVLEATALLFALTEMVENIVDSREIGDFDTRIAAMLVGSKNQGTPVQATNVLTHIQRMDRSFRGILDHYGILSEIAHPNFAGVLGSYAQAGAEKYELTVGPRDRLKTMIDQVVVPTLCLCLVASDRFNARVSHALAEFCAIFRARQGVADNRA